LISEPTTLATDYALGGVAGWLAWRLFRNRSSQESRFLWALAFAALALAALLGGTWHGFARNDFLWKATLLSAGVASFAMLAAAAFAATTGVLRNSLLAVAAAKLVIYSAWMLAHDDFVWVIADTGIALAAVALLHLVSFNGWILTGVAVSIVAAAVQASGFAPHPHFNHNDLYHLIQIGAVALLFRGAMRLRDRQA
jgi:hypothetical protein